MRRAVRAVVGSDAIVCRMASSSCFTVSLWVCSMVLRGLRAAGVWQRASKLLRSPIAARHVRRATVNSFKIFWVFAAAMGLTRCHGDLESLGDRPGIERVGLGAPALEAGKGAYIAWMQAPSRPPGFTQGNEQSALIATGCLAANGAGVGVKPRHKTTNACRRIGTLEAHAVRMAVDVEPVFGNVDADETIKLCHDIDVPGLWCGVAPKGPLSTVRGSSDCGATLDLGLNRPVRVNGLPRSGSRGRTPS